MRHLLNYYIKRRRALIFGLPANQGFLSFSSPAVKSWVPPRPGFQSQAHKGFETAPEMSENSLFSSGPR